MTKADLAQLQPGQLYQVPASRYTRAHYALLTAIHRRTTSYVRVSFLDGEGFLTEGAFTFASEWVPVPEADVAAVSDFIHHAAVARGGELTT